MGQTSIEWTRTYAADGSFSPGFTINPIRARLRDDAHAGATKGGYGSGVGHYCEKVSAGCAFCYSSQTQPRFGMPEFPGQTGNQSVEPFFDDSRLLEVLRRKTPTKFFWCDMTDMFGKWVPFEWIDKCFATMALTPQHTHQILTKRPERMAEYLCDRRSPMGFKTDECIYAQVSQWLDHEDGDPLGRGNLWEDAHKMSEWRGKSGEWSMPLDNCWLGTSIENQQTADERIPHLLRCPAKVRFLSCEPLLGPLDLSNWIVRVPEDEDGAPFPGGIDWVIVGGESGPHARPMHPDWARSLRNQCQAAGVPFFFKQWGEFSPDLKVNVGYINVNSGVTMDEPTPMYRVGKHAAGRLLDGRTWDEFPTPTIPVNR